MTRGIRGATTVTENKEEEILTNTKSLVEAMIDKNAVEVESVSHVFISVTSDLDAVFPAKALRQIEGCTYIPVMCMKEIEVPNSLTKCIRVMMVTNTELAQKDIQHVYHNEAIKLRPDLLRKNKE